MWVLYRNRRQELLGDNTTCAPAPDQSAATVPQSPASPKGPMVLAMEQRDAARSADDRGGVSALPVVQLPARHGVSGVGKSKDCAENAV